MTFVFDDDGDWMFDSERGYDEQLERYKSFKGE
jgi:hypothetical protein